MGNMFFDRFFKRRVQNHPIFFEVNFKEGAGMSTHYYNPFVMYYLVLDKLIIFWLRECSCDGRILSLYFNYCLQFCLIILERSDDFYYYLSITVFVCLIINLILQGKLPIFGWMGDAITGFDDLWLKPWVGVTIERISLEDVVSLKKIRGERMD